MSALISAGRRKAYLRWGQWVSADPSLEKRLNDLTRQWFEQGGPPIDDPDQESAVAREMARQVDGRVLRVLRARNRRATQSYVEKRQMSLDFSAGDIRIGRRG